MVGAKIAKLPEGKQWKVLREKKTEKILKKVKEVVGTEKAKPYTPELVEDEMEVVPKGLSSVSRHIQEKQDYYRQNNPLGN